MMANTQEAIRCSRHAVSCDEILLDRETSNPEHELELRDEHED